MAFLPPRFISTFIFRQAWYFVQEAVSSGVIRLLKQDDYVCSTYRDHVHALSKNVPAKEIMAELFGKKTGICRGQGGSMHMFSQKHGLVNPASSSPISLSYIPCHCHYAHYLFFVSCLLKQHSPRIDRNNLFSSYWTTSPNWIEVCKTTHFASFRPFAKSLEL